MRNRLSPLTPEVWLNDIFSSKAVMQGAVIRRKARDIERFAGMDLFMREIHRRGFRVAENSGHFIIFCNRAPVSWLTDAPETLSLKESGSKSFKDFGV
ncbi:MAG: aspartate aminotransferase [Planktotalea sp.]|uniref:aspartate aminotransferase n=1 Tax=Planktotalea sp. TaxID=2029877 RepID=UPI003C769CA3